MARLARAAFGALPHVLVQHAQSGISLLSDASLSEQALAFLAEALASSRTSLHGYALLDDRWVLLATPANAGGLGELMQAWSRRFSVAFNRHHDRRGTLWTGRYRAAVIDPASWMVDALLYVEQGAYQAAQARSSVGHHLGRHTDPLVTDPPAYWALGNTPFEREAHYRALLDQGLAPSRQAAMEQALRGGWALGSAAFLAGLAEQTERPLVPRPRGRPRKVPMGAT